MRYIIEAPESLGVQKRIVLPYSKSLSNRALIVNAMNENKNRCEIKNLSDCDDTEVMVKAFESEMKVVDVGAAGTSMRFLTAYLAQIAGEHVITGSERMKERPIKLLVEALREVGAEIEYEEKEGFPPLRIKGRELKGGSVELDGGVSSQYISALLMIGPKMKDGLRLKLTGKLISSPYVRMTLGIMKEFGVEAKWENDVISIERQAYIRAEKYEVEADWSAASYWYSFLASKGYGSFFLEGLRENSMQGDSHIVELFGRLGVETIFQEDGVIIKESKNMTSRLVYDFTNMPDMAQTLVVTCCAKGIGFDFKGLQSLKIKETDRIAALIKELAKFGYKLTENEEGELSWKGERTSAERNPVVDTYKDHRMAMAFSGLCFGGKVRINNPEVVSKSYPEFWKDLARANFSIEEED